MKRTIPLAVEPSEEACVCVSACVCVNVCWLADWLHESVRASGLILHVFSLCVNVNVDLCGCVFLTAAICRSSSLCGTTTLVSMWLRDAF